MSHLLGSPAAQTSALGGLLPARRHDGGTVADGVSARGVGAVPKECTRAEWRYPGVVPPQKGICGSVVETAFGQYRT